MAKELKIKIHPTDSKVGINVRKARVAIGMSQQTLGDSLGITFQQIQKYERGINRIGSSRLEEISEILGVSISLLFDKQDEVLQSTAQQKNLLRLNRAFAAISCQKQQKKVIQLVEAMGGLKNDE